MSVLTTAPRRRIHQHSVQSPDVSLAQSTIPGGKSTFLREPFLLSGPHSSRSHSPDFARQGWWKGASPQISKAMYSPRRTWEEVKINLGKLGWGLKY